MTEDEKLEAMGKKSIEQRLWDIQDQCLMYENEDVDKDTMYNFMGEIRHKIRKVYDDISRDREAYRQKMLDLKNKTFKEGLKNMSVFDFEFFMSEWAEVGSCDAQEEAEDDGE